MPNILRQMLKHTGLYPAWKQLGHYPDFLYWKLRGEPPRSPHVIKQRAVLEYARRFDLHTLIETGTYYGEMVSATRRFFRTIYTVEFDKSLFDMASRRFAKHPHIHVIQGDSQIAIRKLLSTVDGPCLFWLDAGYYGWGDLVGDRNRLTRELEAILGHHIVGHVILMDDARGLNGKNGAPSLQVFVHSLQSTYPDRLFEVRHDILRITPKSLTATCASN
jgi:hypothetical protein